MAYCTGLGRTVCPWIARRHAVYISRLALLYALLLLPQRVTAQGIDFGSADNPAEQIQRVWWRHESTLDVMGGVSLIGPQWFLNGGLASNIVRPTLTARFEATLRANNYGLYEPYMDEPYDVLRTLAFARYEPPPNVPLYLRAGPIERMRLGTGHLVNFFNSYVAWDERTIGTQVYIETPIGTAGAFTDNVLFDGVVGGELSTQPLQGLSQPRLASLRLGATYASDLSTWKASQSMLAGYSFFAKFDLWRAGVVALSPFTSFAHYRHHGSGLSVGLDLASNNLIDVARFRLRVALYYNGNEFIPAYFGPFYQVHSAQARILRTETVNRDSTRQRYAGVLLSEARGGNNLVTELRLLFFQRFELWYFFRRHYGTLPLSELHLHLFIRAPGGFRLQVAQHRGGLDNFFSLFKPLNEQTSLVFRADYRVTGNLWLFLTALYTYEFDGVTPAGIDEYLVQRRFEPSLGLRFRY